MKAVRWAVVMVLLALVLYSGLAFLCWDLNVGNWHWFVRLLGLILWFLWVVGIASYGPKKGGL